MSLVIRKAAQRKKSAKNNFERKKEKGKRNEMKGGALESFEFSLCTRRWETRRKTFPLHVFRKFKGEQ
jgi:hypothetical protein